MAKKAKRTVPQGREEASIKSFLDMIAPSVVSFMPDHFICGNTYRCVWALREYPTSTDEQANSSRQRPTSSMLEQTIDQLDDCGLAAAALTGEQDKFPRFHRKGAVPKAWSLLALISIGHMVKANHGSTPLQQIPPTQRARNSSVTTTSWM